MSAALDRTLIAPLVRELLALTNRARERAAEDPFGNPVLSVALAISRRIDRGALSDSEIAGLIESLRDAAFADRARRLAAYLGGVSAGASRGAIERLANRIVRPDPDDSPIPFARFAGALERTGFAAVFTAHPTFALPAPVYAALAAAASGAPAASPAGSHRPRPITLDAEFAAAAAAIAHGRDALDTLNEALLATARSFWPDRWSAIVPRPVILASWVGYDTDGRTDIGWWDTMRLRLRMKDFQLERLERQCAALPSAAALAARTGEARAAVARQIDAVPHDASPDAAAGFARELIGLREAAMTDTGPLAALFDAAIAGAPEHERLGLAVARAGLLAHGLALAHTHTRLNASQLHNVARLRLGITDSPSDRARRRTVLSAINAALDAVQPVPVDFGALLAEQASAARLMMTVAQILKHVDGSTPIRFLIAETETGYTLLAALWLARLFGIAERIEISPLFETEEALEGGARILEEALRSPHWRAYLRTTGRLSLQFGYSDSGRYVGQIAASYLIERLKLKVVDLLKRHGLAEVEVVLFDTHGESFGRGGHPGSMADRLRYLSPPICRQGFRDAGIRVREESAFQGGDGYLLFGTPELALAAIGRIAEHTLGTGAMTAPDPVYADPDFAADFFATIGAAMGELVEDPGYAALLGAFGPSLLDPTGSRPAARQVDGMGGPAMIRHPRELRAIPNNAILHQIGWAANSVHGLGAAIARQPEAFAELREASPRFRRALGLAGAALAHSDIDVLRAVIGTLDPGVWLDRAAHATLSGRGDALIAVARGLERLGLWAQAQAMFRRILADHLSLRAAWKDAPVMASREVLLHALRLAVIHRIWLVASLIPDFSPRHGVTRQMIEARILRLDIEGALKVLEEIFPVAPDPAAGRDFGEPQAAHTAMAYAREHEESFAPMRRLFALVREIGTAITHEIGAFG